MTIERLATDPDYFAHPARFLFTEVRPLFPVRAQLRVRRLVDRALSEAAAVLEVQRTLIRQDCPALTRSGTQCRREPISGDRYCPSHRHLEYEFEPLANS
jgi:hypothetical protein